MPTNPIIFISQAFHPDRVATSQLFSELLPHLAGDELPIRVLCGFGFRTDHAQPMVRRERLGAVEIERCGLRVSTKTNTLIRAVSYFSFMAHVGWKLLWLRNYRLVFGVTVPPFLAILLGIVSCVRPLRYQYMLLDTYPEGLVGLGRISDRSPVTRLWRWLNRLGYSRAQRLVVLGRDMIPILTGRYRIPRKRVVYLPHWSSVATDGIMRFEENALASELGIRSKFVVQYSGNMGLWHDMDTLVRAAAKLKDDPRIHFLFIGDGMRRHAAEELAQHLGLQNITWLDFMPKERLTETLTCCHVALISLREGLQGAAVPCKLYGILASGRAAIAQVPDNSEVAFTLREEKCGVVVRPGSVDDLVQAIRSLADNPQKAARMGERAFAAYQARYTIDQAVAAFRRLWCLDRQSPET